MVINARRMRDLRYMTKRGPTVKALVNGKQIPGAFYADGRRGVVRAYALDAKGNPGVLVENEELVTIEVRGRISWVWG